MTSTIALTTIGVLLALLLVSAGWTARKPAWQIVFGPPRESDNRIALTEFYGAARERGWDFSTDAGLCLDLALGLREAGLDGSIEMWGRRCRGLAILAAPRGKLLRIPAAFWKHHEIDGERMALAIEAGEGAAWGLETNNQRIRTRAISTRDPDFDDATYRDIHLNYMQAMEWLETDADRYRGISRRDAS